MRFAKWAGVSWRLVGNVHHILSVAGPAGEEKLANGGGPIIRGGRVYYLGRILDGPIFLSLFCGGPIYYPVLKIQY